MQDIGESQSLITAFCDNSVYPYIVCPADDAVTAPIVGSRSNIFGFLDEYLFKNISETEFPAKISRTFSLQPLGKAVPYEPALTLFDEEKKLYVAVEIDVPYHEYYRFPLNYDSTNENRDDFFSHAGWYVVHFSENQIFNDTEKCVSLLKNVILSLLQKEYSKVDLKTEKRWSIKEAIEKEQEYERERCLKIKSFDKPSYVDEVEKHIDETETIQVDSEEKSDNQRPDIVFDEESHTYADARNRSGSANYISVTSLIDTFFPYFDEEAYIEKFIKSSGKTREEVVKKMREPSERGTEMHRQIELFLKKEEYNGDFPEFKLFEHFYEEQIVIRNLEFFAAEMQISLPKYNIAGTVDALFKKPNGEYVMVDWKRSKHLIVDGYTKKYGFGKGLSIIRELDNSSYYHYELQQSFYKYILEREYGFKISSMILAVLHPDYDKYYTIKLSDYRKKEVIGMIAAHRICSR